MGIALDDHLFRHVLTQARVELCGQLWQELKEYKRLRDCPSYTEAKAVVRVLNAIAPYAQGLQGAHYTVLWLAEQGKPQG